MKKLFVLFLFFTLGFTQLIKDSEIEEEFIKIYDFIS